jgi:hypothetical protein
MSRSRLLGPRPAKVVFTLATLSVAGCAAPRAPHESDLDRDRSLATARFNEELVRVCEHGYEILIVQRDVGSPGVRRDFMTSCVAGTERKRQQIGEAAWTRRSACVLAGETPAQLRQCMRKAPSRSPERDRVTEADSALAAQTCDHIFSILEAAFGDAVIPAAEQPNFLDDCVEQFEQDCSDDPLAFEREAHCLLGVSSLEEIDGCG